MGVLSHLGSREVMGRNEPTGWMLSYKATWILGCVPEHGWKRVKSASSLDRRFREEESQNGQDSTEGWSKPCP